MPKKAKPPVASEPTERKLSGRYRGLKPFKPGQSGNPAGRPKGSRSKLGEEFVSALYADFQEHGDRVIARVREEEPAQYVRVVASLLPKEVKIDRPLSELSDDEISGLIDILRAATATDLGSGGGAETTAKPH